MADNRLCFPGTLPRAFTNQENEKYFLMVKNGDIKALDIIKEHNIKLVINIINKRFYNVEEVDIDELFSIGLFGLNKAVDSFDINKGTKFSTYAARVIENEILMVLRKLKNSKNDISLDSVVHEDKDGETLFLKNVLSSDIDLEEEHLRNELIVGIRQSLEILTDIERDIVELYYGFRGDLLTCEQIAEKFGMSRPMVSKIKGKAIKKLYKYLMLEGLIEAETETDKDKFVIKFLNDESVLFYAKSIVNNNLTIEEIALKIGVSARYVETFILNRLSSLDNDLYVKLHQILKIEAIDKPGVKETTTPRSRKEEKQDIKGQGNRDKQTLLGLFSGYSEEQIKQSLEKLKQSDREILLLRYPLNGEPPKTFNFIAKKYNIKKGTIGFKVNSIVNKVKKHLEGKEPIIKTTIFEYFSSFSEEQVLIAVSSLDVESKKIIELKYGLNSKTVISTRELAELYNTSVSSMNSRIYGIRKRMQNKLEKMGNSIKGVDLKLPEQMQVVRESSELIQDEDVTLITDKHQPIINSNFEQCREQVKTLINIMNNPTEQVILLLRLGYVRKQYYSENEIAKFLNMTEEEVKSILKDALLNLARISSKLLDWLELTKIITLNTL